MAVAAQKPSAMHVSAKLAYIRHALKRRLYERDEEVDLILTSLVSNENPLLVGPFGSAKTMLLDGLLHWIDGSKFQYQLNKYTTPDELFGHYSIKNVIDKDVYERKTEGKITEATVAYLDEVFKANSACLNTLLSVLNERRDHKGREIDLLMIMGSSNEWTDQFENAKELGALRDRFLLAKEVRYVKNRTNRMDLMFGDEIKFDFEDKYKATREDIIQMRSEAMDLPFPEEIQVLMLDIIQKLEGQGIITSTRRHCKAVKAVKAFAYLHESEKVEIQHLEILNYCLWNSVEEMQKVESVIDQMIDPELYQLREIERAVIADIKKCEAECAATTDNKVRGSCQMTMVNVLRSKVVEVKAIKPAIAKTTAYRDKVVQSFEARMRSFLSQVSGVKL